MHRFLIAILAIVFIAGRGDGAGGTRHHPIYRRSSIHFSRWKSSTVCVDFFGADGERLVAA